MIRSTATFALAAVVVLALLERPAAAYLDPGTGSMIFQVLVAAALTGMFAFRRVWDRVRLAAATVFRRRRRTDDPDED